MLLRNMVLPWRGHDVFLNRLETFSRAIPRQAGQEAARRDVCCGAECIGANRHALLESI